MNAKSRDAFGPGQPFSTEVHFPRLVSGVSAMVSPFKVSGAIGCGFLLALVGFGSRLGAQDTAGALLVAGGQPQAVIVHGDAPGPAVRLAAIELQFAVEQMTGATLPILGEFEEKPALPTTIFIGDQIAARELGLIPTKYDHGEYLCHVEPGRVVLVGKDSLTSVGKHINFNHLVGREGELSVHLPGMYEPQGSLRATYHFLESLGVRYYGPREHLCIYPQTKDLVARSTNVKREPAISYTNGLCSDTDGHLYWPIQRILYNEPSGDEVLLFARRIGTGGKKWQSVNHSLEPMRLRERFGPPPADGQPGIHESHEPDIFPPEGSPSHQPCFSSERLAEIMAKDAADYFDGKLEGKPYGPAPGLDAYPIVPNDAYGFCTCERCTSSYKAYAQPSTPGAFGSGDYSDNFFGFLNRVAKKLAQTHPDKHIATLAYEGYFWPPKNFKLEPNILVAPCPITCDHWKNVQRKNDTQALAFWLHRAKQLKHPTHLWNYWHHPEELGVMRSHKVFPQFSPTHIHRLARSYGQNNVDGVFLCGWGEGLDFYVMMKCFDDPNLNLEMVLDEYFMLSFGPKAGALLKQFYRKVEAISMKPMNGPVEVNEQFFWETQGNERTLVQLEQLLNKAEGQLPEGDLPRARFAAWRNLMEYMKQGRAEWLAKKQ